MNKVITVIFDGKRLCPEKPLDLIPNCQYEIIIQKEKEIKTEKEKNGWDVIESLIGSVDAPQDWAIEHDHYLYGIPKKSEHEP
jgi:hypothetical protein